MSGGHSTMPKIIFFTFALLFTLPGYSRSPAVEPVMGLSIEEIDHVHPDDAVPFDFSNPEGASRSPAIEVDTNYDFAAPTRAQASQQQSENSIPIPLIALAIVLPVFIWFALLRNLDVDSKDIAKSNGTIDLEARREAMKKSANDDDDDFSKAS
jgi:hypothetical protein